MTPRVPAFDLAAVDALRATLADDVMLADVGYAFGGELFDEWVGRLCRALPPTVARSAVAASAASLAGCPLSAADVDDLAWRLAGNVRRLKAGTAVPPWARQPEAEWVPVRVEDAAPETRVAVRDGKKVNRPGVRVRLRFLAGYPAGRTADRFWSAALVAHYRTEFGFSRVDLAKVRYQVPAGTVNLPYLDASEVCGFRFAAWVTPAESKGGPGFAEAEIRCPPSYVEWNRAVMKKRHRLGFACPRAIGVPCFRCPAGRDECPAACHARTFAVKMCGHCGDQAWHDPARPDRCVACAATPQPKGGR